MTLLTLHSGERALVASERLVYAPDEIAPFERVQEAAVALDALLAGERERIDAAASKAESRGRDIGEARGEQLAAERLAERLIAFRHELDAVTSRQRDDIIEIALEVVRRIAGEVGPEPWLAALARRASEELAGAEPTGLRVHPERVEGVRAELGGRHFDEVVGDDTLGRDECWIESPCGRVDLSLETQLQQVLALADTGTAGESGDAS